MRPFPIFAGSTVTTAFSLETVVDWISRPTTTRGLAVVASIASAAFTWYLSVRAELTRSAIERQRLIDQEARDKQLADALTQIRIHQLTVNPPPPADPHAGGVAVASLAELDARAAAGL